MRKITLPVSIIALTILFLSSCRKEGIQEANKISTAANKEIIDKVNAWLNDQKTKVSGDKPLKIESLQQNLSFKNLRAEELYEGEKLLIVPVNQNFQTENNKEKNPVNYLLLILDNTDKIRKGNIVQYIPVNRNLNNKLPVNFFNKFYNLKILDLNGTLTFLSVSDDLLYEMKYENGTLKSYSEITNKVKGSGPGRQSTRITVDCYDVYFVTYYQDGSSTWEYLYSFCNEGEQQCKIAFKANGRTYRIGCDGGGGGNIETAVVTQKDWEVATSTSGFWLVYSTEKYSGNKRADGTGYFTGITHLSSGIVGQTDYTWAPSGNTTSYTSTHASSKIGGIVANTFIGFSKLIPSDTEGRFNFSQIFP